MHSDTVSQANSDPLFCGLKTYSTGLSWLTVKVPLDPVAAGFQFELQVNTIDYLLATTYAVNLVVKFENPALTATITETFNLTLKHPCVLTSINPN